MSFEMTIDKLTGIILKLTGWTDEGELRLSVTVTEILIDQPEETEARIAAGIEHVNEQGLVYNPPKSSEELESENREELDDYHTAFVTLKADPNEILSKDAIYERMISSFDYYNAASIEYSLRSFDDFEHEEHLSIDTNIRASRAFTSRSAEDEYFEAVCDGAVIVYYDTIRKASVCNMPYGDEIVKRNQYADQSRKEQPRYTRYASGEIGVKQYPNVANSPYAQDALLPEGFAFLFLTDQSIWEISGEGEYLGRKAVEIDGALPADFSGEDELLSRLFERLEAEYGVSRFHFTVDKLTGILLKFECWDKSGSLVRETKVTLLSVDDTEYTDARIDAAIAHTQRYDFEPIENVAIVQNIYPKAWFLEIR